MYLLNAYIVLLHLTREGWSFFCFALLPLSLEISKATLCSFMFIRFFFSFSSVRQEAEGFDLIWIFPSVRRWSVQKDFMTLISFWFIR